MKRKTLIIISLFIVSLFSVNGQTTRVTYKNDYYDEAAAAAKMKENTEKLPPYVADIVKNTFKKILSEEFELIYNKTKSIYKKIEILSAKDTPPTPSSSSEADNIYFKNLETKEKILKTEQIGAVTNVEVDFEQYKWEITNESKVINGYKCFKAQTKIITFNQVTKEEMILNRVAWFAPEIATKFGPKGFDGLPGLVLETAENDKICLHATKIELNYKKEINIEKPKCNRTISYKEFKEISNQKNQEMFEEN